jgi:transcriptional regulator with XRE-family HTH domain
MPTTGLGARGLGTSCPQVDTAGLRNAVVVDQRWDVLSDWEDKATELERGQARVGPYPVPGLVRRARRIADLSQREMAQAAGLSRSTVARVESGNLTPSLGVMQRLLATAGLHMVVVDAAGRIVKPMRESDETRDADNRRYPSHLDTILDPKEGEWWAEHYGLARPPETFIRNRERRDRMRAFARWWARPKRYRGVPPPENPLSLEAARAHYLRNRAEARQRPPENPDFYEVEEWDQP